MNKEQAKNKILILITKQEDRRLLLERLPYEYEKRAPEPPFSDSLLTEPFDLCLLDMEAYSSLRAGILKAKEEAAPIFLPILLLTKEKSRKPERGVFDVVDEIVTKPVRGIELEMRISVLLRTRQLSVDLNSILLDGAVKNSVSNEIYLVNQLRNSVFQSIGLIAHVFEFCKFRAVHGYLPPPHLKA